MTPWTWLVIVFALLVVLFLFAAKHNHDEEVIRRSEAEYFSVVAKQRKENLRRAEEKSKALLGVGTYAPENRKSGRTCMVIDSEPGGFVYIHPDGNQK